MDQNLYTTMAKDEVTQELLDQLANTDDADAMTVQSFEKQLTELFQEVPDLHTLLSYQEARGRLVERKRAKGFWPIGRGSSEGVLEASAKSQNTVQRKTLIAESHRSYALRTVRRVGALESRVPLKGKESNANVASASHECDSQEQSSQVIFED